MELITTANKTTSKKVAVPALFILVFLSFLIINLTNYKTYLQNGSIESFSLIFLSIILEAVPFVIIGSFVAAIIQLFISEQTITKVIPKNKFVALITASLMGIIFPVCECAIVPVIRRLIKKGVPLYIAITFMVAVPIVNPIVLLSTFYAFNGDLEMVLLRGISGMVGAITIGLLVYLFQKDNNYLKKLENSDENYCGNHNNEHEHINCDCNNNNEHKNEQKHDNISCDCGHNHNHVEKKGGISNVISILEHTSMEFYTVGKFLIIGAFLSSLMQVFVSRDLILSIGQNTVSSTIIMMILAFVLSLCSEADAFIARTFLGQFTTGSILSFLVYGPMIDIKNTLMLNSVFKVKFIVKLVSIITAVCFIIAMTISLFRV